MYASSRSARGRSSGLRAEAWDPRTAAGRSSTSISGAGRDGTRALDRVLQLPNVARPEIVEQARERAGCVANDRPAETRRRLGQEITGERRELVRSLAERRHVQIDHTQPVIQIAPIPVLRDVLEEIPVRGRDEADIDGPHPGVAETHHLALLDDAQEFDLHRRRDVPDFIQKERAPRRRLKDPEAVLHRPRKGAPGMSEEFALEEGVGERATVDGDKRSLHPRRRPVQPAREPLFADAALAGNQHRGIEGRHARREGHHLAHRGTLRAVLASRRPVREREGRGEDLEARGQEPEDAGVIMSGHGEVTSGNGNIVSAGAFTGCREPLEQRQLGC